MKALLVTLPQAENGVLYLAPWQEELTELVRQQWSTGKVSQLADGISRIDLSESERGLCPGFNDEEGLKRLEAFLPGVMVVGFFCDGLSRAEGVRYFRAGRQVRRWRVDWDNPPPGEEDPRLWPIGRLAEWIHQPVEALTRVARPARAPLAEAVSLLLQGKAVPRELLEPALGILGQLDGDAVTDALVGQLGSEDWVARYHAARAYARRPRGSGQGGRPTLPSLLHDSDEGVREAALQGMSELLQCVTYSDRELHRQIDEAVALGLEDPDEDVRAAAETAQELRRELLG